MEQLNIKERKLIENFFLYQPRYDKVLREVLADIIAWQCPGGGIYGGKIVENIDNPKLMEFIFPRLTNIIRKRYSSYISINPDGASPELGRRRSFVWFV